MKHYADYTEEELDEMYNKLSETAQDFVYSDVIKEEVSIIGKNTGLHIDKWEALQNLVIETILGIVPTSLFRTEILSNITPDPKIADALVSHMDTQIFSIIREDEIGEYSSNSKNIEVKNAIYDDALDSLDPYKEAVPGAQGQSPAITSEKLHIVDDLFSKSPKSKKYVYEKNIKVSKEAPIVHPSIITKEVLAKLDGVDMVTEPEVLSEDIAKNDKVVLRIEKGVLPGKVKIIISKKSTDSPTKPSYKLDPYKELTEV